MRERKQNDDAHHFGVLLKRLARKIPPTKATQWTKMSKHIENSFFYYNEQQQSI